MKIDRSSFKETDIDEAAGILRQGGLVAFPTETVYGLGGNALDETAAARIYAAKGRPSDNPLIVHIADVASLKELAKNVPEEAYALADAFWPGPLTMILNKKPCVPDGTTGGLKTVAIRFPADDIALALIRRSGLCIAAPSANASGRPSPTTAQHVYDDLNGRIEYILDGGPVNIGVESTIIDLTGEKPLILRPGFITREDLEKVIGTVEYDKAVVSRVPKANIVAKAPGMKYRHYAPKGELVIVEGSRENVARYINRRVEELNAGGHKTGVIATDETAPLYKSTTVLSLGKRTEEKALTHRLFAILREFDDLGTDHMFTESFYDTVLSEAIMNRLRKAAGYKTVNADEEI